VLKRLAFMLLLGLNSFDAACGRQARQTTVTTCVTTKTINAAPRAPSIHHSLPGPARPQQNQKRPRYRSRYMNLVRPSPASSRREHDLAPGRAAGSPADPTAVMLSAMNGCQIGR